MSSKTKVMMFVTVIVVSLSVTAIAFILIKPCEYCGDKFCFGTCIIDKGDQANGTTRKKPNKIKTNQTGTRLSSTDRADKSYLDNVVFIGDSRTVALKLHAGLKDENVFAEEGLNHEDALTKRVVPIQAYKNVSIPDAVKATAPDIMIVNFGINGIAWMNIDTFIESYETFIDALIESSPNSIIVIEAVLPVSLSYEQRSDGVSNEKIDEANDALFQMAKDKGLYYLGTDEVLKDEGNDLVSGYSSDGLHFNKQAYDVIVDYILTHAINQKK